MKNIIYAVMILGIFVAASTANAERVAAKIAAPVGGVGAGLQPTAAKECPFVESATVSVNFNSTETDMTKIVTIMSSKIDAIKMLAADKAMDKFELQSSNYSVSTNNNGNSNCNAQTGLQFQFYGSASFVVSPANKAAELTAYLVEKGFQASVNVNSYRQCQ
jgi:hypothetical protein